VQKYRAMPVVGGQAVRWLSRRIQRQATILLAAVVVIINLVALSGVLHLSDRALGGVNAAVAAVLASVVALVASEQIVRVHRAYVVRAREKSAELVPTAGSMIGEVVGRDVLCHVMIEELLARRIRRAHVVIGGLGTGKTAFLVRLTKLLAEQHAVPVPVRLRDAQEYLDFRELARRGFIADAQAALVSDTDVDTVWRQLCQDDKIVVLADGLEEALIGGPAERDRDNLIRLAIRQANEQRLPLLIVSRPDDSLRYVEATIVELGPLSGEAALAYLQAQEAGEDQRRIAWVVEVAEVAEAPFYLQIARQLHRAGLMEYVSPRRTDRPLDSRIIDRDQLRLWLLETWMQALIQGHFLAGVSLSREDRQATVEHLSLLACIGLRLDRLEVRFDDVEAMRTSTPPMIITEVEARLGKLKRRFDLRLAADWGMSLGLVEARGNGVRFSYGIMQAYLGSRLIDLAMTDEQYRVEALRNSGQEFLLALVMHSRVRPQQAQPDGAAPVPIRSVRLLCEEAMRRSDVKVLDLYAAALQIDSVQNQPEHGPIVEKLAGCWRDVWAPDQRILTEAKLRLVRRFGEAARMISEQRRRNPAYPAKPAYSAFYRISCYEPSYPIRLQSAQEIGAGGDDAFAALQGVLGPPADDPRDGRAFARAGTTGGEGNVTGPPADHRSQENEQEPEDRALMEGVIRAWLTPMLTGSVTERSLDAQNNLEQWLQYVSEDRERRRTSTGTAAMTLPTDTQILITREIGALKHLVYETWTTPMWIRFWWGDAPGKDTFVEADLRVGGTWRYAMTTAGGSEVAFHGEYREIVPDERIVSTQIYEGMPEAEPITTVTFTERDGRTTLTLLVQHTSREHRNAYLNSAMGGMQGDMDRLERLASSRDTHPGTEARLTLEAALAQGFKYAANRRRRHPHATMEARPYLADQALEMLRGTDFWYARLTLVHALCLWSLHEPQSTHEGGSDSKAIVQHWTAFPSSQPEHPFVAEATELAVLALESGQPDRFIWIDESGVAATIGSGPASPTALRNRDLWIPPSTGWTALEPRGQRLLADVLLLLSLAERGARPSDRARLLYRTDRKDLPPCLSRDRSPLDPTRTVGMAETSVPGSNCLEGCPFALCPYPPKGEVSYRIELSDTFVHRQQALIADGSILRRAGPWQATRPRDPKQFWKQMGQRDLRRFWKEMGRRANEHRPGQF
jgi:uncharacterized protein YndB with AHSA1/START domain